jgi:hypothetical protein
VTRRRAVAKYSRPTPGHVSGLSAVAPYRGRRVGGAGLKTQPRPCPDIPELAFGSMTWVGFCGLFRLKIVIFFTTENQPRLVLLPAPVDSWRILTLPPQTTNHRILYHARPIYKEQQSSNRCPLERRTGEGQGEGPASENRGSVRIRRWIPGSKINFLNPPRGGCSMRSRAAGLPWSTGPTSARTGFTKKTSASFAAGAPEVVGCEI